ncbi:MAG: HAMP domain-containing histidine kinase [Treponema sp.]|jgi:signal transduction histidine kinase|nr:HAMP domain-containing histidine kinase [Treponema sp.]
MISLTRRLTLTYALFISLALLVLTFMANQITRQVFTSLIKQNITEKSGDIVRVIGEQYNPDSDSFDIVTIEAIGMYFIHEGYILTISDERGGFIWDARSHNMRECTEALEAIAARMEGEFRIHGSFQRQQYPIRYAKRLVGNVSIETYGPFFYSETETLFLSSINRLFLIAGLAFVLLSVIISTLLSRAIACPILEAEEAARQIAASHSSRGGVRQNLEIRLSDRCKTKELAGLSRSINELARELEEGDRRQKQLVSDIAHELRTPLTYLQGSIEAILDGVWVMDREHLASCHEEILRIIRLVQDINTLTNLEWEHTKLDKTEFDLAELLRVTAEQFKAAAHKKGVAITLNLVPSPINADYDRLKQVFINLLSNAMQHTDQGSVAIAIETSSEPPSKNRRISITDTGSGIAAEDLPRIFERLYRADKSRSRSASRSAGGAGIGLSIAAAIVSAHGGTISAESGANGSTFRVFLP